MELDEKRRRGKAAEAECLALREEADAARDEAECALEGVEEERRMLCVAELWREERDSGVEQAGPRRRPACAGWHALWGTVAGAVGRSSEAERRTRGRGGAPAGGENGGREEKEKEREEIEGIWAMTCGVGGKIIFSHIS